jgi:hypothetical protein
MPPSGPVPRLIVDSYDRGVDDTVDVIAAALACQ